MFLDIDKRRTESPALTDNEGNSLTYGELVNLIRSAGKYFEPRTLIFQLCENNVGSMTGYLAAMESGAVPVMLSAKTDKKLLSDLTDIYEPAYFWTPADKAEEPGTGYEKIYEKYGYVLLRTGNRHPLNEELELCMTTSGSTGSPKLVRYKKGNLYANARNVAKAFGWTEAERPVCDLGMQYTMGLNVINTHLYAGAHVFLTSYNLFSGDFWDYIRKNKCTNFTGVPFSYDIMARLHFERMDLPFLTTLSQGGGKLTDARFIQLAEYAAKNGKRFIASFGTTETSARMACLPPELAVKKTGSIGRAIPEGELFLVDDEGNRITEPDTEGELCYKGPNVTMGYALCKEDLLKGDEFKGEYHTGDLARFDADGDYYITGRRSRFLKLLSYRVSLDRCEQLISQEFGIECACSGNDNRMNIYLTDKDKKDEVLSFISKKTGLYERLFKIYNVPRIIRNDSGKIMYSRMDAENAD